MMKCGIALGLHSYFSDEGALSLFSKNNNDRIPYFDTCPPEEDSLFLAYSPPEEGSIFDIRFFRVSFPIKLAVLFCRDRSNIRSN